MQREFLLKGLAVCCFLLLVQNIFQSLGRNATSFPMLPDSTSCFVNNASLFLPRTESSKPAIEKRDLLLSVPFYVYEDLAWNGATRGGKSVEEIANPPSDSAKGKSKHGSDYWMWKASLNGHPMRTKNMSEAKLFFVPWLMNFWDCRVWKNRSLCVNGLCDIALLLDSLDKLLDSPAFQQYPDHHVIVRSFWSAAHYRWNAEQLKQNKEFQRFLDAFTQMQALVFEGKDIYPNKAAGRHTFTSYHVGSPCPIYSENDHGGKEKPYDVGMIGSLHKKKQAFKNRRNICKWLGQINDNNNNNKNSNATMIRVSVCGEGSQCPALAESRFGFHVAGDTYSSQRLMDTILSGTVPIFTHLHQYELAGDWIDWSQLSYYLPVHDDTGAKKGNNTIAGPTHKVTIHSLRAAADSDIFEERLRAILEDEAGYQAKHEKILEHIPLFDYTTLYPFDTYMYLFQAELFPETRHPIGASRWSALRLPPPLFVDPPPPPLPV